MEKMMDNDTQATIAKMGYLLSMNSTTRCIVDGATEESDLTIEHVAQIRKRQIARYTRIEQKWLNSLGLNVQIPDEVRAAIIYKTPLIYLSAEQLYEYLKVTREADEVMKSLEDF